MVRLGVHNHREEVHRSAGSQLHMQVENKERRISSSSQEKTGAHWCSSDLLISRFHSTTNRTTPWWKPRSVVQCGPNISSGP